MHRSLAEISEKSGNSVSFHTKHGKCWRDKIFQEPARQPVDQFAWQHFPPSASSDGTEAGRQQVTVRLQDSVAGQVPQETSSARGRHRLSPTRQVSHGDCEGGRGLRIFSFPKKYFHFVMINESDKHQTDHRLIMTESFCQRASTHFIWLEVVKRSSAATAKISQIFNYFALTFFLFRLSGKSIATLLPYQFRCSGKKKCLFKLFCRLHYFEFWYSQIFFKAYLNKSSNVTLQTNF